MIIQILKNIIYVVTKNSKQNFMPYTVDIALIKLPVASQFLMGVQYNVEIIRMNDRINNDGLYELSSNYLQKVHISGWGRTDYGIMSTNLKYGLMWLDPNRIIYDGYGNVLVNYRGLKAGKLLGGSWICEGDSGGKLYLHDVKLFCVVMRDCK